MRFVSLFAGAGGLDLGLEQAGWRCDYAGDLDAAAVATLEANKGKRTGGIRALDNAVVERRDVRELTGRDILSRTGSRRGDFPLLAGGPPCQSWSSAGHQLGFADPRGQLFKDYVRIAQQLDVRWLLFENVRGLLTARGQDGVPGSALQFIRDELLSAGWQTQVDLLNAADFGVPQRRVRLVMIGYHLGDAPKFPIPTHADGGDVFQRPWRTLGECLARVRPPSEGELIFPSEKLAQQLRVVSPGSGVRSPGKRETTRPGGHWGYKQGAFVADLAKPARTVTASAQQDWIVDNEHGLRRLSPRECAAIQSFPACWKFEGGLSDQYRLIGNAVPPALAKAIGLPLLAHAQSPAQRRNSLKLVEPAPLPKRLQAAIAYTKRDEAKNGESRRASTAKRRGRVAEAV